MFETPSLSFVPCRPPGEPGVTRLWQDARKRVILIFDFLRLRIFPIAFPLNGYNGGAAERCQRYPPSDPHLVLLVHAGAATTPARGGSALMAVSLLLSGPSRLETKVPMPTPTPVPTTTCDRYQGGWQFSVA